MAPDTNERATTISSKGGENRLEPRFQGYHPWIPRKDRLGSCGSEDAVRRRYAPRSPNSRGFESPGPGPDGNQKAAPKGAAGWRSRFGVR
jgi:hypothetical protein